MTVRTNPALAAMLTLVASSLVAGTTLLAKSLGTDTLGPALHPLQASHGRFIFALMGFAVAGAFLRPRIVAPRWRIHGLRVLLGWAGISLMFTATVFIPLSDATAISFLNPVVTMLLAIPLLGETVGKVRISAAVIALTGAIILLRPTPDAFQPAALFALGAAVMLGFEMIMLKQLSGREGPYQVLLLNALIGTVIASVAVLPVWRMPTPEQWAALVAVGLVMASSQAIFIQAIQRADASFVAPFWYATLVFAALYDFGLFGVVPDAVSVLGALVITSGAGLLAWREARLRGRAAPVMPSTAIPSGTVTTPPASPPPSQPGPR
ncbi:DMT family transporter [Salipiger pallidus]|nr:DMT family transporter [Salipiger pallidus]